MKKRVFQYIKLHHMIEPGETCLIGLSGGVDSVCLLMLLYELREELDCNLRAVHINHNIRGEEANRDASRCRQLCEHLQIPYEEYSYPVEEMAREAHLGTEEMGRNIRKNAFLECLEAYHANRIALAHHQNDLAETCLFHLARGTSLDGLAAIRPVREPYIRPLLCLTRDEIEHWMRKRGYQWCEDSTNMTDDYTRNQIRHHVIPYLEKQINPQTVSHIAACSEDIAEAVVYLDEELQKLEERLVSPCEGGYELELPCPEASVFLIRRLILSLIARLAGVRKDITREHVESVYRLCRMQTGKCVSLPYGLTARRTYTGVRISRGSAFSEPTKDYPSGGNHRWEEVPSGVKVSGEDQSFTWGSFRVVIKKYPADGQRIPEKTYTKWFDYDKINPNAVFRSRMPGDYIVINQAGNRRKLKDYLIDCKIPRESRDQLLLLARGSEILWVVGYRIGETAKVCQESQTILQIQVNGGTTDE